MNEYISRTLLPYPHTFGPKFCPIQKAIYPKGHGPSVHLPSLCLLSIVGENGAALGLQLLPTPDSDPHLQLRAIALLVALSHLSPLPTVFASRLPQFPQAPHYGNGRY